MLLLVLVMLPLYVVPEPLQRLRLVAFAHHAVVDEILLALGDGTNRHGPTLSPLTIHGGSLGIGIAVGG